MRNHELVPKYFIKFVESKILNRDMMHMTSPKNSVQSPKASSSASTWFATNTNMTIMRAAVIHIFFEMARTKNAHVVTISLI